MLVHWSRQVRVCVQKASSLSLVILWVESKRNENMIFEEFARKRGAKNEEMCSFSLTDTNNAKKEKQKNDVAPKVTIPPH
jgi:hypothetical protein